jgi:hypothetical protein
MADTAEEKADKAPENITGDWLGDDEARNFGVEGNDLSGYIGVSPEYMTYADDTHKPYSTDEEVLPPAEQLMFAEDGADATEADDKSSDADSKKEEPKKTAAPSSAKAPTGATTSKTASTSK